MNSLGTSNSRKQRGNQVGLTILESSGVGQAPKGIVEGFLTRWEGGAPV